MADFVAVLKKTIEGLGETTPDVREKVYQKARLTIGAKLAALNPPAPAAIVDRQRKALEEAIRVVEAEYAAIEAVIEDEEEDPLDELDALFSSLSTPPAKAPAREAPAPRPVPPAPAPAHPSRAAAQASMAAPAIAAAPTVPAAGSMEGFRPVQPVPVQASRGFAPAARNPAPAEEAYPDYEQEEDERAFESADAYDDPYDDPAGIERDDDPLAGSVVADERRFGDARPARLEQGRDRSGLVKIAAGAAAALVVFGGLGYVFWTNQDGIGSLFGGGDVAAVNRPAETAPAPAEPVVVDEEEEIAALPAAREAANGDRDSAPATDAAPKFTQRLAPDGSEIDDGPGSGSPMIGEGTSVAAATQPAAPETAAPASETALPVGQRAIFYEERTSVAQGSAEPGATVWSLIQESPGADLPPEPAIRAEASVPGKDIQLRMTIRRNADKSLPASHIVELIFITPDNFAGGAIDNVLRMTMKETEESAGNPLVGMTAKIADGFFLLALNDEKQARDANNALLRRQNWIDVPIVYKSGRRALMTMEKGIPGEQVFEQALRAWQEADSG
ncbi:MAG: hypothetical protein ACK4U0_01665 [Mesorhizobium sp.]